MVDPSPRASDATSRARDGDQRAPAPGTSLTLPSGASVESIREAIGGLRRYRVSLAAHWVVTGIWPFLFPLLVLATILAARSTAGNEEAFNRVPVLVVAVASGTPKVTMMVALTSILALAKSCRASARLVAALIALGMGFLVDTVALSIAVITGPLADRAMLNYLPVASVLSGGASLFVVTGAIERMAPEVDAPRLVVLGRWVQTLAVGAVVAELVAFGAWVALPEMVGIALTRGAALAGIAAAGLHFALARYAAAALVAEAERRAFEPAAAAPDEFKTRRTPLMLLVLAFTALAAFAASVVLVPRWQVPRDSPLLRAVDREATVVAERCGDARAKLPIANLEAHQLSEDRPSDLTLTAKGDVFHGSHLVARLSGACVVDLRGGVLVSVDARGLISGPKREPLGTFKPVATVRTSGWPATVREVRVDPDGFMKGLADDGTLYHSGPPPEDAGQERRGDEARPLIVGVTGEVSRARRTALLLDSLVGRLDPADR